MCAYNFSRDLYFIDRIRRKEENPFHIEAHDFIYSNDIAHGQAAELAEWLATYCDSFRCGLAWTADGGLVARAAARDLPLVETTEVGSVAAVAADRWEFLKARRGAVNLFEGPLVALYCFRSPAEGKSLVRIINSHFSSDFVTWLQVKAGIDGFMAGARAIPKVEGYLSWMEECYAQSLKEAGRLESEYWQGLARAPFLKLTRTAVAQAGAHRNIVTSTLSPAVVDGLRTLAASWGVRLVDIVSGTIVSGIAEHLGESAVPIGWTGHGRFPLGGRRFSHTRGWLSDTHPLLVQVAGDRQGQAFGLRTALYEIPNCGALYRWVRRFALSSDQAAALDRELATPISVNFREAPAGKKRPPAEAEYGTISEPEVLTSEQALTIGVTVDVRRTLRMTITVVGKPRREEVTALGESIALRLQESIVGQ